ncbi:MAG: hypothetical protein CL561_13080 [Alphaproteobacteria bacterium]|nr:hypothetical protein [Alphaproteobacteria bacterium]|tara:strand:- start:48116 stop:49357 length:1242 start_codon:yes stop_codon:yes gene_type:complete
MKEKLFHIIHSAFIAPFQCLSLCVLYFGAFISITGITAVQLFMVFDFASLGMWAIIEHFVIRSLFVSMLIMPLWLWLSTALPFKRYAYLVLSVQIVSGTFLFLAGQGASVWVSTLLFSISVSSYWTLFHLMMSFSVSDHNSANEVCMADAGVTAGVLLGSVLGGVALTYGLGVQTFIMGTVMMFIGTLVVSVLIYKKVQKGELALRFLSEGEELSWHNIKGQSRNIYSTAYEGAFQVVADFLAPVWLKFMSVSAMGVGLLSAAKIGLKLLVSPIVGHFANQGSSGDGTKNHDLEIGLGLKCLGWVPWLFMQTPFLYAFSSMFWTAGQHFFSMGLASRWYKQRSVFKLALREFSLGAGRLAATLVAVPLLYWSLNSYIVFSILLSAGMMLTTKSFRGFAKRTFSGVSSAVRSVP